MTATKGPFARGDSAWSRWAISSFPVPDSPATSTVAWEGATRWTRASTSWIRAPEPITRSSRSRSWSRARRSFTSRDSRTRSSIRASTASRASRSTGFVRKWKAPAFMDSTARSMVPWAVTTTTSVAGLRARTSRRKATPSPPGIR